jgi:hypothetical protein
MECHGELVRIKPAARYLTSFYLYISAGGALGGVFVSLVAPRIFAQYYEYPLVMIGCWLILMWIMFRDEKYPLAHGRPVWVWAIILLLLVGYGGLFSLGVIRRATSTFSMSRNFYGVLAVLGGPSQDDESQFWLELRHGHIRHGAQYLDEKLKYEPTTYYMRNSGVGRAMKFLEQRSQRRIGAVGLGIGTVAAYARPGDTFRFYEINPEVIRLATDPETKLFTFWNLIAGRGARAEMVLGDARISLQKELAEGDPQRFDLLILDAFSGDSIPAHLLTVEAFEVYLQHLAADGVLAVHISNRYLDLRLLMRGLVDKFGLQSLLVIDQAAAADESRSQWVLLARPGALDNFDRAEGVMQLSTERPGVLWTDDFSDLFGVLR